MRSIYPAFILVLILSSGCASSGGGPSKRAPAAEINLRKEQAHTLIAHEQYQGAIDVLLPLGEQGVKDSQLYSMLGKAYWKLGLYDRAVGNYEAALRLDYTDATAHLEFGETLMEMGKVGRALTEFELAISHGDHNALAYYNYGLALYEFGRKDAALAQWELASSRDPQNPKYAEAMGIALTGKDDLRALEYFERALELGTVEPTFHNNFGLLLIRLKKYDQAEAHFESALDADPENETYRINLAVVYLNAKDYPSAITVLEDLIAGSPDNRTYRIYLGRAYYEGKRFQDAIALLEEWLQGNGASPPDGPVDRSGLPIDEAYNALAMSFRGVGKLDAATVYIGKAVELEPGNAAHLNNYGVILAESGRIEEAKAQWKKVLLIEPDNAVAKENLSAIDG
jgi:superkiller protein 3